MTETVLSNRYKVTKKLGEGGMGIVYEVEDALNNNQKMAFKKMSSKIAESPDTLLQFKQEFRVMNQLKHPNTVNVFDYGILEDNSPYLTMEVVDGYDLSKAKDLDLETIYKILIQLSQALNFIHSRLYVHCDIKSENITLKNDGNIKLMDFGLMRQLGLRSNGQISGTVDYLPPEVPTGGVINASSDLYSVGVLAYELVTGKLPFEADSILEIVRAHINKPVEPPSKIREIPEKLERIILKLLAKDQDERYKNASEVIADLVELSGQEIVNETIEQKRSYLNTSVLVGRKPELQTLETALDQVTKSSSRSVFIGAPAGVGKSRLIQEFKLQVQLAEYPFLTGQCFEQGMSAYKPMIDAFKQILPLTSKEELNKYGNVLVKIFPELSEKGYTASEDLQGNAEKLRLFDNITAWLADVSKRNILVVFIDDLHWIDQASIELLNTCIRDLKKEKIMFLGTFRDDEVTPVHPLWQTIEEELTKFIKLEPFTSEDISNLIKAMLGEIDLKKEVVEHINKSTGGNAFFISEVMRYLVEEEVLQIRFGEWYFATDHSTWELPTSIEDTVKRRLQSLSNNSQSLLRLAAVAGRKLKLSLFKAVSNWEENKIFDSIDELIERQFLNHLEQEYLFPHDRVRETLYESLENEKRKELHEKVAVTIETENENKTRSVSGELAYHFSRGIDQKKAIKYLLMAGFSNPVRKDASNLLNQAMQSLESLSDDLPESWINYYLFEIFGKDEEKVNEIKKENNIKLDKNLVLDQLRSKLAWISYMMVPKITIESTEKLIASINNQQKGLQESAQFQSIRASSYTMIGQNSIAFSITDPIINDEKYENSLEKGLMLFGRLNGLLTTGRLNQLVDDMEKAITIFEKNFSKLSPSLIWSYGFSSFIREDALAWLGKEVGDNKFSELVKDIAKKHKHLDLDFWSYYPNIVRFSLTGDYNKIKGMQEKLMNMIKRLGRPIQHENRFNICVAFAAIQHGQILEAKSMTKKIVNLGKQLGNPHQQANGLILEGMLKMEENKYLDAIDLLKKAVNLSQTEEKELKNDQLIPALYHLAEAYYRNHEIELSSEVAERAFELTNKTEYDNPYHLTNIHRILGYIYGEKQDYEKSHNNFLKSSSIAKENKLTIQEGFTHVAIGEVWYSRKKFDLTRNSWNKAISKFRDLNNDYQAGKLIPRLNSIPKPSISKQSNKVNENNRDEKQNKYTRREQMPIEPRDIGKDNQATEIGYKLIDLLGAIGLSWNGNGETKKETEEKSLENKILIDKLKRFQLISNFGQMILSTLELDNVLNNIIDRVLEVTQSDRGFLLLLNEKGEVHDQLVRTKEGSINETKVLNFSKTFIEKVIKTGKPLWVADAQADSRFAKQKSVLALDLRTVICVPLREKEKVIGLLYVDKQSVIDTFSEDDLNLVESMATFASIAIVNARLHNHANERNEKLQILNDLSRTVSDAFTREELLNKILNFAIRISSAEVGYILTGNELNCEVSMNSDGEENIPINVSQSIIKKVMDTGKSVSVVNTDDDDEISSQASIIALDIRSVMCVPLITNARIMGVVYVSSRTLVKSFTQKDLTLLEDIVGQAALALENLSLLEVERKQDQIKKELEIAKNIQQSMLPAEDPIFNSIEISGSSQSATEVGGDYYDYITLEDERFALAFGDVTGHGVSAGLLMTMAKSCMFVQCGIDPNVAPVMESLNKMICGSKTERRIRMGFVYSIFDFDKNTLTISSAGHPLPYYYKHEKRDLEPIKVIPSYQLGVRDKTKFRETTIELSPKDILVYFTDGIVEARSQEDEEYGYDRLEEFIKNNSFLSSKELREAILEDYFNWIGEVDEMDDDITVVVVKVKPLNKDKNSNFIKAD